MNKSPNTINNAIGGTITPNRKITTHMGKTASNIGSLNNAVTATNGLW